MAFVRDSIDSFGFDRHFLKIRSQTPKVRLEGGRFRGNQGCLVGQQHQATDALTRWIRRPAETTARSWPTLRGHPVAGRVGIDRHDRLRHAFRFLFQMVEQHAVRHLLVGTGGGGGCKTSSYSPSGGNSALEEAKLDGALINSWAPGQGGYCTVISFSFSVSDNSAWPTR